MEVLRTPDHCFEGLPQFPFEPHYAELSDQDGGDPAGPLPRRGPGRRPGGACCSTASRRGASSTAHDPGADRGRAAVAWRPTWSASAGRTSPPPGATTRTPGTSSGCVSSCSTGSTSPGITLVCQDWGGLIGLRLVGEHPDRFARVVAANTFLPTGRHPPRGRLPRAGSSSPRRWRPSPPGHRQRRLHVGSRHRGRRRLRRPVPRRDLHGRGPPVPHPGAHHARRSGGRGQPGGLDGPRVASTGRSSPPSPTATPSPPAPTASSRPGSPGAAGQPHTTIAGGGHFLQEDRGPELAGVVVDFVAST